MYRFDSIIKIANILIILSIVFFAIGIITLAYSITGSTEVNVLIIFIIPNISISCLVIGIILKKLVSELNDELNYILNKKILPLEKYLEDFPEFEDRINKYFESKKSISKKM